MFWYKSSEPSKHNALLNARHAFAGYIQGTEKAYMVESALQDIQDAYQVEIPASENAKKALKEEDEELRLALMQKALDDVLKRLAYRRCGAS